MKKILLSIFIILMAGCQNGGPKQTAGTYVGAATGAIFGAQFGKGTGRVVGAALGTFLGSQLGSHIGKSLDTKDRELADRNAQDALERARDLEPRHWENPNNHHQGDFTVTKTQENSEQVCRDYVHKVIIDGKEDTVHGRACRNIRDQKAEWQVIQ